MDSTHQNLDHGDNTLNGINAIAHNYLSQEILPGTQYALNQFLTSSDFAQDIQLAFGENADIQTAYTAINNLITGSIVPIIEIVPQIQLNGNNGAYVENTNTIYLAQEIINSENFQLAINTFLEETGHFIDSQLNDIDSPGDEGELFAQLVPGLLLTPEKIAALKSENDHGELNINGENIAVEFSENPGEFTVNNTGEISINFLADAGSFTSEMGIFSLEGMENLTPGSVEYIQEAANRALSNSNVGHIVIRDPSEGARFSGELGESDKNQGDYSGITTYNFTPGDRIGIMLVPQGTVQEVVNNPNIGGNKRPLFSLAAANPNNAVQLGELVSGTFGWEDLRNDGSSDADYNDIIFQIQGVTGSVTALNQVINPNRDWTNTPLGQEIITFASQTNNLDLTAPEISASLFEDTGLNNADNLTKNARIIGQLSDSSDILSFQAKLNNGNLVDILSELNEDGSFELDTEKLTEINGGQLADGSYQLTLQAEDIFGNLSEEFNLGFSLDTTKPEAPNQLAIQNDSDLVTNNNSPTLIGEGENGTTVRLFNGQTQIGQAIAVNGVWEITPTTAFSNGINNLIFNSIDAAGNISDSANLEITVDTTAPQINITNPQENAQITNGARLQGSVNETGSQIDKLNYRFGDSSEINVPINDAGEFDIELNLTGLSGQQNLILTAIDIAGNSTETTQTVIINAVNPEIQTPGFMLDTMFDSAPIGDSFTTFETVNLIGQTEANATVTLQETGTSITADAAGKFVFTEVELTLGDNSFTVVAEDIDGNTSTFTTIINRVEQDNSDVVLDWNGILLNAIYEDKTAPPAASRNMAITQIAVFDAINSITGTYENYHFTGTAPTEISAEAAAVSAAYQVLVNLYPQQQEYFDNALIASLAEITDGIAEDNGVTFGETVANEILLLRSTDGWDNTVTYTPGNEPGEWQPTPPEFADGLLPHWGQVTPFGLTSGNQFRPDGTPDLDSSDYAAEFNQVKDLGSINSTIRTADQTEIAQFWEDGAGTFTPPGHWNQIAQNISAETDNSLVENARVFALLNISLADAGIAAWDSKYHYDFWRPITAIQNADSDNNPDTISDADWIPLVNTPPFPEYVSGHSTFSGAADVILTELLGNNVSFTTNSLGMPGVYRQFDNFTDAANEAGISRIYGGIHFNSANLEGLETGRSVGDFILENLLAPIDNTPPTVNISTLPSTNTNFIEISFDEPVTDNSFTADNYNVVIAGGEQDGQTVVIDSVEKLSSSLVRLNFANSFTTNNYQLTVASGITDIAGNATTAEIILDFNVVNTAIRISPTNGEELVALNRETIVRFGQKIDPNTVNNDSIYLIANGERIAGNIRVSSTEQFATFFYENPLPASTEVRVVVDGSQIIGRNGVALDGDLDGIAGGIATADFTTLPITRIEGTDVWGYVYDSYNKNPDGSDIPLAGVVVRLDALPDVFAVTDENGYFILEDVPAPEFYVYIDGSEAIGADGVTQYASLGKPFHSVPGEAIQLFMDGEAFDVYLPPMAASDVKQLSTTENTEVGFGEVSQAFLQQLFPDIDAEAWERVQVTFNPGSAQDDDGNAATQAMIIPVDPNRLPAPLPPGVDPQLVISIQAGGENGFNREADGGATNFDVPAPIEFPNLEGLAPGEKSLFWSFDHDAGDWVVIGTGTVSEDGLTIKSDPGVGVLAPGWHFVNSGSQPEEPPEKPPCEEFGWLDAWKLVKTGFDCFKNLTRAFQDIGSLLSAIDQAIDLKEQINTLKKGYGDGRLTIEEVKAAATSLQKTKDSLVTAWEALSEINPISKAIDVLNCVNQMIQTGNDLICRRKDCSGFVVQFICDKILPILNLADKLVDNIDKLDQSIRKAPLTAVCIAFDSFIAGLDLGSPLPQNSLSPQLARNVEVTEADPNILAGMDNVIKEANIFEQELQSGVELARTLEETRIEFNDLQENGLNPLLTDTRAYRDSYWRIDIGGFEVRGRSNELGELNLPVLASETNYHLEIYNPQLNILAVSEGVTARSGESTILTPFQVKSLDDEVDSDRDELVDIAEEVIGTSATNIDTDGDGINDLAEIQQGLDPLGGRAFPTGIISSLPLRGEAKAVVVTGSTDELEQTAYIATGSYGLAIVNASQFDNPIILGQLDLPGGDATDVAVDTNLQIAAVATNTGALKLVDISDPMLPKVEQTINIPANQVEIYNGIAYATVGTSMYAVDLLTGEELQQLNLGGSGTVTGMAREGEKLYTYVSGSDTFSIVDISNETQASILGQLRVSIASIDVGVFAANGVAYLAGSGLRTIDVSDSSNPTLISSADNFFTARDLALNGSGLALVATENQGLGIYNINEPTNTNNFITQIDTSGFTYDVAVASGIAYVADGSGGLKVINYLPFDAAGQAPRNVTINSLVTDIDPNQPGIQVLEGSTLSFTTAMEDDVQVRNVELLFNGEVVQNDVSFPFDLSGIAPNITPNNNQLVVQVRATDTGGNTTITEALTFDLLPDTFAPEIVNTTPENNGVGENVKAISISFNENIDISRINLSGITLTSLGADGIVGSGDDSVLALAGVETPSNRRLVVLLEESLAVGQYQLTLDPSIIADNTGNNLESAYTLEFTATKTLAFSRTDFPVGEEPSSMTGADFDGDGDIDLAIAYPGRINANSFTGNTVSILFNNGDGSFSQPVNITTEVGPQLQSGDFNGDGNIDLAVNSLENDNLSIFLNDGNGGFTQSGIFATGERPESIPPADLDGDGDLDIVILNTVALNNSALNNGDTISVLLNDGNAGFTTSDTYTLSTGIESATTGDLDNDGDLDLAVVNRRNDSITLLFNDGNGNFDTSTTLNSVSPDPIGVTLADFNNDGNLDLITNNFSSNGRVYVFLSNGDGTFAQRVSYNVPGYPNTSRVVDLDLDGDLDIATNHAVIFLGQERREGNQFSVLRNNGDGTFTSPITVEVGNFPVSPVVADLDGDGDLDVVTSNGNDGTISVLDNEII